MRKQGMFECSDFSAQLRVMGSLFASVVKSVSHVSFPPASLMTPIFNVGGSLASLRIRSFNLT